MEDLTGKEIGHYQIVSRLGVGGMASVYKAHQPSMDRHVALKVLSRELFEDPEFLTRFRQEARLVADLQHPHILPVFDFGEDQGYAYIVMPFTKGGTLADLIHGAPLPLSQVRLVGLQVGDALGYAHSRGFIHRDVKPSNILIDEGGNALLADFGIARMIEATSHLTTQGVIGTPSYMSPEQGRGDKLDLRTDIYALGIVLYETATGTLPFQADTPVGIVYQHNHIPLPPPRKRNPDIPEALELVLLKMLAKDPADRYQQVNLMIHDLRRAVPEIAESSLSLMDRPASHDAPEYKREVRMTRAILPDFFARHIAQDRLLLPMLVGATIFLLVSTIAGVLLFFNLASGGRAVSPPFSTSPTETIPVLVFLSPTTVLGPSQTSAPIPTQTSAPPATSTAQVIPSSDPVDFIRAYYTAINDGEYEITWSMLSNTFKDRHHCCNTDGSYQFEPYANYWNSVEQVEILSIEIVQQNTTSASISALLRFHYENGSIVDDNHVFTLVQNDIGESWLIDEVR